MPLSPGSTVGRYEIRALLGSGGMGEVYKAGDPTLGRDVALKVLKQDLSAEAGRVSRFLQEARAASALNHPNILTIHEVGDHAGSKFIVSEMVDGETLRDRMTRHALTLREVLGVAIQTASALAAAHAAGIVHRDIKPDNLMLRPDGYVKVLDFGVATLARPADDGANAQTIAPRETTAGMVVGTMAYMSPEQARGLPVDGRSDCFSLGVVLYELVAGRTPFAGPTPSDIMVAILDKEPPPIRQLARGIPLQLELIISKALDKDPNLRYQTIADLRVDLQRLKNAIESGRLIEASESAPIVDQPLAVELTEDSAPVLALGALSRGTMVFAAIAIAAVIAGAMFYDRSRVGTELPLQLPEGAAPTKARDVVQSMGYTYAGSSQKTDFSVSINLRDVTTLAGLPAAREAIRDGFVGRWEVGLAKDSNPGSLPDDDSKPKEGEFGVRLSPKGDFIRFTTGMASSPAAVPDRARATAIGLETITRLFKQDASTYQLEYITREFPASTVEMTWRSTAPRFGQIEQFRVHLQGERVVFVDRSFVLPAGYSRPADPLWLQARSYLTIIVVVGGFLGAWTLGIWVVIKSKNWDLLKARLPLAMCGLMLGALTIGVTDQDNILQGLLGVLALAILIAGTLLPSLSGLIVWVRRRSPQRLWAADQLSHGRIFSAPVTMSVLVGALAGLALAAGTVLADYLALQTTGFTPSVSREVDAITKQFPSILSSALTQPTFIALALAAAVEMFDYFKMQPLISTAIIAIVAGLTMGGDQQAPLPLLVMAAGVAAGAAIAVSVYRTRGLLAPWMAFVVAALITHGLAARSLHDIDLTKRGNLALATAIIPFAFALYGLFKVRSVRAVPGVPAASA